MMRLGAGDLSINCSTPDYPTLPTRLRGRPCGGASRGFSLAHEIDEKGVVAKLEDGVLKRTLPKSQGAGARSIAIQ